MTERAPDVPVAFPLADGLPKGWSDIVRFCPSCGSARDDRSLLCGYRDGDDQVVYWWCHHCRSQVLLVALDSFVAEIVELEPDDQAP